MSNRRIQINDTISLVSLSPNGEYIFTYSEGNKSIDRWNEEGSELIPNHVYRVSNYIDGIKVNNKNEIFCYRAGVQISSEHQENKLQRISRNVKNYFQINDDFEIKIYRQCYNELCLNSSYKLSSCYKGVKGVFIDEDINNIWAVSLNYLFHWDLNSLQLKFSYSLGFTTVHCGNIDKKLTVHCENIDKKFTVLSKGDLIVVKYFNEVAIFLKRSAFSNSKYSIKRIFILDINKQPIDASMIFNNENPENDPENKFILYEYNSKSRKAFGIGEIIDDDIKLAKVEPDLLSNLINHPDPSDAYIEDLYNKCMKLVKEDPKKNLKFLNIITMSMSDLSKKYLDYVTKFNSELFMILDPFNERIYKDKYYPQLNTFSQEIEISKISKYSKFLKFLHYLFSVKLLSILFTLWSGVVTKQCITLVVPINDSRYPEKYSSWLKEFLYPQPSVFVDTYDKSFYTSLNGEAIINFKWNTFGRKYCAIWLLFSIFLVCFTIASYPNSIAYETRIKLYQTSIALGFVHIIFELRQFFWSPKKYFLSIWNFFDASAYLFATIVSIYWIRYNDIPDWALSISCLMLDLKFLLFFRAFESFVPSENTNLFYSYPTSLLATYLFLAGNQNSLSPWAPEATAENTILFILMALFSFLIVIYLMNLIIGLLNMSIEKVNDKASYLIQKAEVIVEIELFYLLPHQRRWISWFPEVIYYSIMVERARAHVKEAINKGYWEKEDWPEMKQKILKHLNIDDAVIDLAV
ncbi:hypothetical protein GLOIN_2v1781806 [Rhizophagus clarus]|uniref:Ion transport domain-containing protein n=1 Tax=Rhizophagus clarus TaxID=94130 RepID=A0A8H3LDT9_9GLOM|nr:hypothetical protein GLOIN_2v1781806 [Rhizophagus clarus]